jgi:flagellar hook protein FlgE
MSVLSSLYTGVSGLQAQGEALGVVSDNIANANTTGFKASRAEFQDIVAKSLKGVLGGNQIGRGTHIGAVNPIMTQGNIDSTEKATDLAISGDGYFVLRGAEGTSFTRDGSLHFDREGFLVSNDNQRVQGYQSDGKGRVINQRTRSDHELRFTSFRWKTFRSKRSVRIITVCQRCRALRLSGKQASDDFLL